MSITKVLIIEGLVNLMLVTLKFVVGMATQSSVILADALHSLTDLANNFVAYIASKIAKSPPDTRHPYGHRKFEYLAIFLLAVLLAVVALEVVLYAINHHGQVVTQSHVGLVLLIFGVITNLLLSLWERRQAKRLASDLLAADADHTLSDVMTSIAVIVGWQLAAYGYYWLDTLFSLAVAAFVARLSWSLFKQALPILVDEQPDESVISPTQFDKIAATFSDIKGIEALRTRALGSGRYAADLTLVIDSELSLSQAHELAHRFEDVIKKEFNLVDVIIHIEPFLGDVQKGVTSA
jgi:cation diffusion facilitator family transporter